MFLFSKTLVCTKKNGDNEGAIQSYNQIIKLVPELPEPYLALGFLYSANGDDESEKQAILAYRKYIELSPRNAQRDSISQIISALEQMVDVSPDLDDSPAPVSPKMSLPAQTPKTKALQKPFEGKWISNRFVQSTMIPQWVFDISFSGNEYTIRFHYNFTFFDFPFFVSL
ncbi:hypothetical protein FACS1894145_7670 [Bacteroidia bacterium]|nr:hypothetical protein FACS1894145_7670 [Bacteroidia bacterium]